MTFKTEQFYVQCIAELEKQVAELLNVNAELVKQNTELAEQVLKLTDKIAHLSKNSSNSSKPLSSDIVKSSQKTKSDTPRNIGAQPGHPKHKRTPFTIDQIDHRQSHTIAACPTCGGILKFIKNAGRVVEQIEIVKKPVRIEQHTSLCNSAKCFTRARCERIWTVMSTCASQGKNAFDFICQSINAHFSGQPLPSRLGP